MTYLDTNGVYEVQALQNIPNATALETADATDLEYDLYGFGYIDAYNVDNTYRTNWITDDYNLGLCGSTRKGPGAFYFSGSYIYVDLEKANAPAV
jgi:hypothetical protein